MSTDLVQKNNDQIANAFNGENLYCQNLTLGVKCFVGQIYQIFDVKRHFFTVNIKCWADLWDQLLSFLLKNFDLIIDVWHQTLKQDIKYLNWSIKI